MPRHGRMNSLVYNLDKASKRIERLGYQSDVGERRVVAVTLGQLADLVSSPYKFSLNWHWEAEEKVVEGEVERLRYVDYIRLFSPTVLQVLQVKWTGNKRFDVEMLKGSKGLVELKVVLGKRFRGRSRRLPQALVTYGQINVKSNVAVNSDPLRSYIKFSFSMLRGYYNVAEGRYGWSPTSYVIIGDSAVNIFNVIARVDPGKARGICKASWIVSHMMNHQLNNLYLTDAEVIVTRVKAESPEHFKVKVPVCVPEELIADIRNEAVLYLAFQDADLQSGVIGTPVLVPYTWRGGPGEPYALLSAAIVTYVAWMKMREPKERIGFLEFSKLKKRVKKLREKLRLDPGRSNVDEARRELESAGVLESRGCGGVASNCLVRVKSELEIVERIPLPKPKVLGGIEEFSRDLRDGASFIL